MMGFNIWGNILLRQEFNPIWFLPQDSYLFKYFAAREQYFPDKGEEGFVMLHGVDFKSNLPVVEQLMFDLENTSHIHEIDAWYPHFKNYVNSNFGKGREKITLQIDHIKLQPQPYRANLNFLNFIYGRYSL